jgi:signal peptidase I
LDFRSLSHKFWYAAWFALLPLVLSWVVVDLLARAEVVDEFEVWYVLLLFAGLVILSYSVREYLPFWKDRDPESRANRRRRARGAAQIRARVGKILRRKGARVSDKGRQELQGALAELDQALHDGDDERIAAAARKLEEKSARHLAFARKSATREYLESIGVAVIIAALLRLFVIEAFKIPSESMVPTLMVGDHIFVSKYLYGVTLPFTNKRVVRFAAPSHGEVVVFAKPSHEEQYGSKPDYMDAFEDEMAGKDFIKRIVGVAGDRVELREDVLWINGKEIPRCQLGRRVYRSYNRFTGRWENADGQLWVERHGGFLYTVVEDDHGPVTTFGPITVPPGQVFLLGDNRDNSNDSRYWGPVPVDNIKGRAMVIWWSNRRPHGFQWDRFGRLIMTDPSLDEEHERALGRCSILHGDG